MLRNKWNEWLIQVGQFFSRPRSRSTVKKTLITLFSVTFLVITYLLSVPYLGIERDYKLGESPNEDIRVYRDIRYTLDDRVKAKREAARMAVPYVFDRNYEAFNKVVRSFEDDFQIILNRQVLNTTNEKLLREFPYLRNVSRSDLQEVQAPRNQKVLIAWAKEYAAEIFGRFGILDKKHKRLKRFYTVGASIRTINAASEHEDLLFKSDQIIFYKNVFGNAYGRLSSLGDDSFRNKLTPGARKVVIRRLLQLFYRNPYVTYNAAETTRRKESAAARVKAEIAVLKRNTLIVREGEAIDKSMLAKLQILRDNQQSVRLQYTAGMLLTQVALALAVAVFLFRFSDFSMNDLSSHLILHSLILLIVLWAFLITRLQSVQDSGIYIGVFMPVGFVSTMLALLFGPRATLPIGIYLSIVLFMISGYEPATLLIAFVSTITGLYAAEKMERRTQFLKGAAIMGASIALVVLGIDLVDGVVSSLTMTKLLIALLNGFLAIMLTIGVMPVFETIFNLATKFRLMEMADYNNHLLTRLANEAPSTYTHSLMVANLSERAVSAIGGDTLLTRVGCLYHDIGKMGNPSFYAENKHLFPRNEEFKRLGPLKSSQVIVAHVIDGIRMGREHRLPEKIISFIPEHHGTTTMQYFYHQSLEESKKRKSKPILPKELFAYPGPRPQTKETAVVMIADSVEAASRTLAGPDPEAISELIERIVRNKLEENQFDQCPLTLADLNKIKTAFQDVLMSSLHARPNYPTMKETTELARKVGNNGGARKS